MYTNEMIKAKKDIDNMSQYEMAKLWRFATLGHPYFDKTNGDISQYFIKKFMEKGGFTSELSKQIGW
jgi:hypothetical protein